MPTTLTLFFQDETGHEQQIVVQANPFSIGRAEGNDLVINDSGMSRRHALLTFFNDVAQVTDCGSANGTLVNTKPINGNATLKNGDLLTLGLHCKIRVQIAAAAVQASQPVTANHAPPIVLSPPTPASSPTQNFTLPKLSPMIMAGAATGLILLVAMIAVAVVAFKPKPQPPIVTEGTPPIIFTPSTPAETPTNASGDSPPPPPPTVIVPGNDSLEKNAVNVIRNISNEQSYPFTPNVLAEIKRRSEQYANANIAAIVKSFATRGAEVATAARSQGIKPEMVFYLGLAETNGGQNGDPIAAARGAIAEVIFLRDHFGTNFAEQALLVIAATKVPGGNKKSHPLLACMRNKIKNPQAERNVWFLHEHGCLSDTAYEFVLKFLAYGVIAQKG